MVQFSFSNVLAASVALLASVGSVVADLEVTTPSAANWWVAQSQNLLAWTCHNTTIGNFTVLVSNTSPTVLEAPMAIISIQNNFDCSILVDQSVGNLAVGSGYQVLLANPFNETDVRRFYALLFSHIFFFLFRLWHLLPSKKNSPRLPTRIRSGHVVL
ncbi:hypothetical protein HYPSUDRAFT_46498 [Hypholoma sublateritium FD-334 SS-4]|uniref:Uncharacterized protein n=1 Tax=Hypholoma sublateritium (strain FD-334 SS-4) TaxID=945553 RepID=A0A0D2NLB1_HYPSF|nr:hypothetical protein HYPSUDRAFT_46498 [Hypholoma sublateritium FD-334 SS-4]